jgi:hypothetical protein
MIADKTRAAHYLADYLNRIDEAREANDVSMMKYYRELLLTAEDEFEKHYGYDGLLDIKLQTIDLLTK